MRQTNPMYFGTWNPRESLAKLLGITASNLIAVPYELCKSRINDAFNLTLKIETPNSWLFHVAFPRFDINLDVMINQAQMGDVLITTIKRHTKGGTKLKLLNATLTSDEAEEAFAQIFKEHEADFLPTLFSEVVTNSVPKPPNPHGQLELNLA